MLRISHKCKFLNLVRGELNSGEPGPSCAGISLLAHWAWRLSFSCALGLTFLADSDACPLLSVKLADLHVCSWISFSLHCQVAFCDKYRLHNKTMREMSDLHIQLQRIVFSPKDSPFRDSPELCEMAKMMPVLDLLTGEVISTRRTP